MCIGLAGILEEDWPICGVAKLYGGPLGHSLNFSASKPVQGNSFILFCLLSKYVLFM